jgi:hypothetical protein
MVESGVQIADWCALWKISNGGENLVLQALQFQITRRLIPILLVLYGWLD